MIYAQRDPQWANEMLGFNTEQPYTIGYYGCLLCCISELAGVQPDVMNHALKAVNGFTGGGLLVFSKIGDACRAIPGSRQVSFFNMSDEYRWAPFPVKEIERLRETLAAGKPVILEVDSNPSPQFAMHWVLAVHSNAVMTIHDPWTGTERSLIPAYGPDLATALVRAVYVEVAG